MTIKEIMTPCPMTVSPQTLIVDAARIMFEKNFNGLPVVDRDQRVAGLITQQDLILHTNAVHLPTLINLLSQIQVYKKDSGLAKSELTKVLNLTVGEIMNKEPMMLSENSTIEEAAQTFASHHAINPILIIGTENRLSGVISRYDLLKFFVGPASSRHIESPDKQLDVDKRVNGFISDFESRFLFVSRSRTRVWLWVALAFGIAGFLIAWFFILRINI